jgi:hypothetical protein
MTMPGEDWLNPSVMLEAFEARAARMAVGCGMRVAKAPDSESGEYFHVYFHRPLASVFHCSRWHNKVMSFRSLPRFRFHATDCQMGAHID